MTISKWRNVRNLVCITLVIAMLSSTGAVAAPWKFIAVGDSRGTDNGVNTPILTEIAAEIVGQNAEFVVFPGDLVNGYVDQTAMESQLTTWRNTMLPVYNAGIGVYAVRGNHDVGNPAGTTAWNNVLAADLPDNGPAGEINLTYSVTNKMVFVLGLDEYITSHRVNQTWVDSQLAGNTRPHVFAFGHEPAFKGDHSDCLDDYPTNRDALWSSLTDAGSRAFFVGHDHFYDHALIDNGDANPDNDIHQYIVGTAGAPLRDRTLTYDGLNTTYTPSQIYHATAYGYSVIEIDDLDVSITWWQRNSSGDYVATSDVFSYSVPPVGGDANKDGAVDLDDLSLLASNWDTASGMVWGDGDFDGDGEVGLDDLSVLASNWALNVTADQATVPEPMTLLVLSVAAPILMRRRRRA